MYFSITPFQIRTLKCHSATSLHVKTFTL